jgi:hypothetical protein
MFRIQLKKTSDADALNAILKALGLEYIFNSAKTNQQWVDNINTDKTLAHLKPENGEMTTEGLKEMFPAWTKERELTADTSFGRMEVEEAQALAKFVAENKEAIRFIKNADDLIETAELEDKEIIQALEDLNKKPLPKLRLPEDMQTKPINGGVACVKSWGLKPFWVLFGAVESPVFMKKKEFVNDKYNSLYRDEEGLGYLLVPLYDFSEGFAERVVQEAQDMGMREHPNYFISAVYTNTFEIQDVESVGTAFADAYTKEELIERLTFQFNRIIGTHGLKGQNGISYNGTKRIYKFKSNSGHQKAEVAFLNSLVFALSLYDQGTANDISWGLVEQAA